MNETYSFNIQLSGLLLTDEKLTNETKLGIIQSLKSYCGNSSQNFSNVNLSSLLDNTITFQICGNQDSTFLFSYGNSLIAYYGQESTLDSKILLQIETVLLELNEKNIDYFDIVVKKLWERLEKLKQYSPDIVTRVLKFSKNFLEDLVLNWIESVHPLDVENYYIQASSLCPKLYQSITGILHQLLVCSKGNSKVLEVLETFVSLIILNCGEKQKNFLKFYPKEYHSIVSLIMIPPELFPDESSNEKLITRSLIGNLLVEKLVNDNEQFLIILSHFPKWLCLLYQKLKGNEFGLSVK